MQQVDVVFGRLVSDRGATLGIIDEPVVGPCVNVVPLRATWLPPPTTVGKQNNDDPFFKFSSHEVFVAVQQQQTNGMPFEPTGLSHILTSSSCCPASWAANTVYGSVFQYQNPDDTLSTALLSGTPVQLDVISGMEFRPEQLWVLVKPCNGAGAGVGGLSGEGEIEVLLFGTTDIMAEEEARGLGERFCELVAMGGRIE